MKIILIFFLLLNSSFSYAEIFKCEENAQISYQQSPCKNAGKEFVPTKDISIQEQQAAVEKLKQQVALQAEQKKSAKEADDKERAIRAQEEQATAAYRNANANRAQVIQNAVSNNNDRILREQPYFYPAKPSVPIPPIVPHLKPYSSRTTQ